MSKIEGMAILDELKRSLERNPEVLFAGDFNPVAKNPAVDLHYLIIAPKQPTFEPEALEAFLRESTKGFQITRKNHCMSHKRGDFSIPVVYSYQKIGELDMRTTSTRTVSLGSFRGLTGKTQELISTSTQDLIQHTLIQVYPHPNFAEDVFHYISSPSEERNGLLKDFTDFEIAFGLNISLIPSRHVSRLKAIPVNSF